MRLRIRCKTTYSAYRPGKVEGLLEEGTSISQAGSRTYAPKPREESVVLQPSALNESANRDEGERDVYESPSSLNVVYIYNIDDGRKEEKEGISFSRWPSSGGEVRFF